MESESESIFEAGVGVGVGVTLKSVDSAALVLTLTLKRQLVATECLQTDGAVLSRCTEARDLGVTLDQKLTFAAHVDRTVSQGNWML